MVQRSFVRRVAGSLSPLRAASTPRRATLHVIHRYLNNGHLHLHLHPTKCTQPYLLSGRLPQKHRQWLSYSGGPSPSRPPSNKRPNPSTPPYPAPSIARHSNSSSHSSNHEQPRHRYPNLKMSSARPSVETINKPPTIPSPKVTSANGCSMAPASSAQPSSVSI